MNNDDAERTDEAPHFFRNILIRGADFATAEREIGGLAIKADRRGPTRR